MVLKKVIEYCVKNGFLINKEVFDLFKDFEDFLIIKSIIDDIYVVIGKKIINKKDIIDNKEKIYDIFLKNLKNKNFDIEKIKINLGLGNKKEKININDFVFYFKNRFNYLKEIINKKGNLKNLVSINRISNDKNNISVIGMVLDKKTTKNNNIIFEIEDLTGRVKILVNSNKKELYNKASDICLDSVLGFECIGNSDMLFCENIFFPDSNIDVKKKSIEDENVLFLGDLHFGSKLFLKDNFLKFIDYLNNVSNEEVKNIKYIFIVGDIVAGVGNYPNQEKDLEIIDIKEQFFKLSKMIEKIRKDVKIFICPGNHDGVRLMEPQPVFDKELASSLYSLENVNIVENPSFVNIGKKENFEGFDILMYHGFSFPFYANNIQSLVLKKAINKPEEIMKFLLKNRHIAPNNKSVQYFPSKEDKLLIKDVPDIFVSGHLHKSMVSCYNNILLISVSSWESMTSYQEKLGNKPDFCKVPMFNLKSRAIKILDFEK